jgi:hypothetical protein
MQRVTHCLAGEYGVRQFVDIGSGTPAEPDLHQVAQDVGPRCRVVYVDHDPVVPEYADALPAGTSEGRTTYLQADIRYDDVLAAGQLRGTPTSTRPWRSP